MHLDKESKEKLHHFIKHIENKEKSLLAILHEAQSIFGYIPEKVQKFIAEETDISRDKIEKIVNSNNFFSDRPKAKYKISICNGSKCSKKEPNKLQDEFFRILGVSSLGEITEDGLFSVESISCIGACRLAPIFRVGHKVYGIDSRNKLAEIIEEYRNLK